ncbi:hypothetical protein D9619_011492 [Psilocybe cf. subviscida]|uniref:Uncharacterized protein n=1 Tax=Psilocybe cf. subviscida TaxID=2480587 RepID=A0A8H5F9J0_9AGAR|nr:hypothetical protein D9619_011492 [Psilocybe cf. subviscida]
MQSKLLISTIFALSLAVISKADTIVAFSGNSCDGDVGNTVQCDGSCHQFGGRHSVRVNGGAHCVTFFENNSCTFQESLGGTSIVNGNSCANVNTGGPVGSFLCSSQGTICEV